MCISRQSASPTRESTSLSEDIQHLTRYNRWMLGSIGIWPIAKNANVQRYFANVAFMVCNFVLCFTMIPCILHIIYAEKDASVRLKLFGFVCFCSCAMMKYLALMAHRSDIRHCLKCVQNDWRQLKERDARRKVMTRRAKMGRNLTLLCMVFMYSSGIIYHLILPFARPRVVNEFNRTMRPMIYPSYSTIYDTQKSPMYEFIYICHWICGYVMYSITAGICGLTATFAMHVCGQIDVVLIRIDDLAKNGDAARSGKEKEKICRSKKFAEIVEHHLAILKFSAVLEQLLREICLMEFVSSTLQICLLEYFCITDWKQSNAVSLSSFFLLLSSLSFNIFILCYISELLMNQSSKIGSRCFMTEWYRFPPTMTRGMILIIAMSSNPIKITAGRISELSISTFGSIVKTSLAYLNFLQAIVT